MRKFAAAILAVILTGVVVTGCAVPEEDNKPKAKVGATQKDKGKDATPEKDAPKESVAEANARAKAADYLDYSSFSRQGLIDQLKYEGFSIKDATYGVDAQQADWNKQAAKKAKEYLDTSAFSRQSLIDQLKYEGFTPAQALYGVNQTGL